MKLAQKYLEDYAESEARQVQQWCDTNTETFSGVSTRAVVIPAYDESCEFITRLTQHPDIGGTILIVVVNSPDLRGGSDADTRASTHSFAEAQLRTEVLLTQLLALGETLHTDDHLSLNRINTTAGEVRLIIIDRCSRQRIPTGLGVGLARKIGCDIALTLIHQGIVASPWIFTTDADALLPDNYFRLSLNPEQCAAVHRAFEHVKPGGISQAQSLYDLSMHYYVRGLQVAGSAYAYYSLGSALVISAKYYAMARGFPKRAGGEDFYLLNKLAKIGEVHYQSGVTIRLLERESSRVPFGTGPAVRKISALQDSGETYAFFHPDCFETLRVTLNACSAARTYFSHDQQPVDEQAITIWLREQFQNQTVGETAVRAMNDIKLTQHLIRNLKQHRKIEQYQYHCCIAFDALKTLRYLHHLRDQLFGTVNQHTVKEFMQMHESGHTQ